jgi:soluble lytic murein transglycosylase
MAIRLTAILAGGLLLLAPCAILQAAVYVHVDTDGVSHFTDAPTKSYYKRFPAFGLPGGTDLTRGLYAELIDAISAEHGVDALLVKAIIQAESNFDRRAVSKKGAQGLMQLMPDTAFRYQVRNPFDPEENIRGGVQYLRFLWDTFPNQLAAVVAAYNAGENAVLRHGGIPPYAETREYVRRVLGYYGRGEGGILRPTAVSRGVGRDAATSNGSPSVVYRQVAPDGSLLFTNVPPLSRGATR